MTRHLLGPSDNSEKDQAGRWVKEVAERPGKPPGLLHKDPPVLSPGADTLEPGTTSLWCVRRRAQQGGVAGVTPCWARCCPRPPGWSVAVGKEAPDWGGVRARQSSVVLKGCRSGQEEAQGSACPTQLCPLWTSGLLGWAALGRVAGHWPGLEENCLARLKIPVQMQQVLVRGASRDRLGFPDDLTLFPTGSPCWLRLGPDFP